MSSQSNAPGAYGPLSPTSTRAPGRRRETSESFQFPQNPLSSPTGGFNRDEQRAASPPPSLQRRRTDLRDSNKLPERDVDSDDKASQTPFGSLKRTTTGPLTSGFGAPSSPWANAPTSAGLSPMGSFGSFGSNQQSAPTDKRPTLGSGRAESRFKNLLSKDTTEESTSRSVERKASMSSLTRVNENESWRPQQAHSVPPDEMDEEFPTGSAALAADDLSPPQIRQGGIRGFGTPNRTESRDDFGFGAFGMTSDTAHGFGQAFPHQTPGTLRQMHTGNEPMSPTDTNPYQSPEQHGIDHLTEDLESDHADFQSQQLPGLGGFGSEQHQPFGALGGLGALPNLGRMQGGLASGDRSQTSSAGANRGFPGLGGIGALGGMPGAGAWPSSQGGLGTPSRQTTGISNAFGGGLFATSTADLQSPSLAGLGGSGLMSPPGHIGGSRMASIFPPAMQEQLRQGEQDRDIMNERSMQQQLPGQNDYTRAGNFGSAIGEAQTGLNELEQLKEQQPPSFGAPGQPPLQLQDPSRPQHVQSQSQSQIQSAQTPNQPPPPQQRTMVMPDRMRWIYRDPQGQTQGPWSGLEMHDWYKAGFFSPELLVKKNEDPEYEPLAQLIRRIGNSREPFLVPQIGIPHGAPSNNGPNAWAGTSPPTTSGTTGAQPPFASSFPSFGTTLTADQQNALERRKQEEQYLMARQKEHLAQQQIAQRMQHQIHQGAPGNHSGLMPGGNQLHHHSSAQSLHSQPSFGSMTSPSSGAFQPSPVQAPQGHQPGFFDHSFRGTSQAGGMSAVGADVDNLGHIREEEIPGIMDRLNLGNRTAPGLFGAPGQPFAGQNQLQSPSEQDQHDRQVQQMLQDRARLQQEQAMHDAAQVSGAEQAVSNERLQQFHQLQSQGPLPGIDARFQPAPISDQESSAVQSSIGSPAAAVPQEQLPQLQELTLTEQVQKAASAQQSPVQPQFGLPHPFPPAPSQSPLPAPAAQRHGRQSVADQLQTEERDLSQTPSVDTPSAAVAPWAKETAEAQRGPSLKEIQEAEAKKAAEAEAALAAARRAAFEREMEAQSQVPIPAPGLPATASWAQSGSPSTPTGNGAFAWAKAAQKTTAPTTAKSMAQIQKEEEARKKKLAVAAATSQANAMSSVATTAGGKSYANLAGKVTTPPIATNPVGGAWTTVGSGGKPKTPAVVPPPTTTRATSSGVVPTMQSNVAAQKKPLTRTTTATSAGSVNAHEEFRKWAVGELRPDLNKGISGKYTSQSPSQTTISTQANKCTVEEFISNLILLPMEVDMLTEAVHSASSTIDSRHFAEEFIRRKKLADKGLIDTTAPPKSASPHGELLERSGGWSEVAKKGPGKEASTGRVEGDGSFRVVAAKKKGGKK